VPGNSKAPRATVAWADFAARSVLAPQTWLDGTFHPAVIKREDGTYRVRVETTSITRGSSTTAGYGYFFLDSEGVVTKSPHGRGRECNGIRVTGMDEAAKAHAGKKTRKKRTALAAPTGVSAPPVAADCGHGPDPNRTTVRPEVADAVEEIRQHVARRMRDLRAENEQAYHAKATVRALAVSGMDLVEITVRMPAIPLHDQAARECRYRIIDQCKELAVEFDELLAARQTIPPFHARTTVIDPHSMYGGH
jgi:hypothetical protein